MFVDTLIEPNRMGIKSCINVSDPVFQFDLYVHNQQLLVQDNLGSQTWMVWTLGIERWKKAN